jgi:putative heme-binding domain-containing protein
MNIYQGTIMSVYRIAALALLLCFTSAFAQTLPPPEKPVQDADTGLNVPPGFDAELIYKVDKGKYGTWIAIAFDDRGRLTVSDQGKTGTFRLAIPKPGEAFDESKIEKLNVKSGKWGMLYAFGHLYSIGNGSLTRAKVLDNGDLGPGEAISPMPGGGEHGPHSLVVSPDGKSLYAIAGNYTKPPPFEDSRIPKNWGDDVLLQNYAYGHNGNGKAPGGWVMRLSPDGKEREMLNMGYRNPVDFALNRDGELFVYDADMEWDLGAPWYRPTRVNHGVSGGENGWRATSKKWRKYFPDTVGSVVDIGPGCPTGVIAGVDASFPTHYRDALFLCDWTFATMYSLHLKPNGSSYTGELREFVSNTKGSLSLTDVVIGPDGHMYFAVGGRGQQSYLYRVRYTGDQSTALSKLDTSSKHAKARADRHKLEAFHGKANPGAVAAVWPSLGSDDYHLRYAARIALEWNDAASWADKAYAEKNDVAAIHALLGLARTNHADTLAPSIDRLTNVNFAKLDKTGQLALLRTYAVIMSRGGKPADAQVQAIGNQLDPHFPATDDNLNEELCRVLSYLQHPNVVAKTIKLIETSEPKIPEYNRDIMKRNGGYGGAVLRTMDSAINVINIHYLFCLKDVTEGWTLPERKVYLGELKELLTKQGGNMFKGYINKIRESAIASVPEKDRPGLQYLMGDIKTFDLAKLPKATGPGQTWTVESGLKVLNAEELKARDFKNGEKMFSAGMCVACHRIGTNGGGIGPDLTNVGKRSDYKSMLESILQPGLIISDQFAQHELKLKDGGTVLGRVVTEDDAEYGLVQSGFEPLKLKTVKKGDVVSKSLSKHSMMPPALINSMNPEELKDLIAYMVAGANKKHPIYRGKKLNIELVSAVYGVKGDKNKQMDLKKRIQKSIDEFEYDFQVSNNYAGKDPAPGVVKVLQLTYKINGKTVTKTYGENGTVDFQD